jgi:hypothetical protein
MTKGPSLYSLLPEHYRARDKDTGSPLEALAGVLDDQRERIESGIDALYRDWFVETCADWALPYLAMLAGREELPLVAADRRVLAADSIAFARRKGTHTGLEHELAAITGWPVQVAYAAGTVTAHYWDEPAYALRESAPHPDGEGRYRFHPMGVDCPLFAAPRRYAGIEAPFVRALDAPAMLTLDTGPGMLARAVRIMIEDEKGDYQQIPAADMAVADLAQWRLGPAVKARVLVDPLLGRFLLNPPPARPGRVAAGFAYAAPGNVGGGPYERRMASPGEATWIAYVHGDAKAGSSAFRTLQEALEAFRKVQGDGLIRILDSGAYETGVDQIGAAPLVCPAEPNAPRRLTIEALSGESPVLRGALRAAGGGAGLRLVLSGLWIDGRIEIEGDVEAQLDHCSVHPVTDRRKAGGDAKAFPAIVLAAGGGPTPTLALHACLTGPIELPAGAALEASDSAIDGYEKGKAVLGRPAAKLFRCTLLGGADFASLEAIDTILGEPLTVGAADCRIWHCFVPQGAVPSGVSESISHPPPKFESKTFGMPGYARLDPGAAPALGMSASNGSEIGLFNAGHREQRLELMKARLIATVPIVMTSALERQRLVPDSGAKGPRSA